MNEITQRTGSIFDEHPQLRTFRENFMKHHPDVNFDAKNLYVIQSFNQDGELTDEHYGLNLITDGGLTAMNANTNNTNGKLALLEGVEEASSVLEYAFPTYTAIINNTSTDTANSVYPMAYDSTTGIVTQHASKTKWIYDYNIDGITRDIEVNCIIYYYTGTGAGGFNNTPVAKVTTYDVNGLPASFTKHLNEKMVITLYIVNSFHEDLIDDAYDQGIYITMNPGRIAGIGSGSNIWAKQWMCWSSLYTAYDATDNSAYTKTYTSLSNLSYYSESKYMQQNGEMTDSNYSGWTLMTDPRCFYSRSMLRFGNWYSSGFSDGGVIHITEEMKLATPEEIVCDTVYTNNSETGSLSNTFGLCAFAVEYCQGMIPVADFSISAVKGYNYTTHAWDIDISFIDEPDAYYDNPFCQSRLNVGISGATPQWDNYVYTNPRAKTITGRPPAVPVTALAPTASKVYTMYATDKWWDVSSWELIANRNAIPQSLQNKKYFISSGGDNDTLIPTYDQAVHRLNVGTEHTVLNTPAAPYWVQGFRPIINKDDGWILVQDHILFMNGNDVAASYRLHGPEMVPWMYYSTRWEYAYQNLYVYDGTDYVLNTSPTYNSRTTYYIDGLDEYTIRYNVGNKLLVGSHVGTYNTGYPTKLRLYTIIDASTPPTYIDITVDTNTTNRQYFSMYSGSQSGYYVIQDQQTHCANIISLADGSVVKLENVMYCFAVEYSNYCVYMDYNSSPIMFHVYDMTTNTIRSDIILPSEYANIVYMCGWRDYVYIKSTSGTSSYVNIINVEDGSINLSSVVIPNVFPSLTYNSGSAVANAWRLNMLVGQMYTEECMIISQPWQGSNSPIVIKYSDPETTFDLFKNGYLNERPIDAYFERNNYNGKSGSLVSYIVHDEQSISQSKLLLVNALGTQVGYQSATSKEYWIYDSSEFYPSVLDIGLAIDSGSPTNLCRFHGMKTTDATYSHGALVYWNNGIIRIDKNGDGVWRPLQWFIASQVTGTTNTIQAYNNPKKIGHKSINIFKTNRGIIQHTQAPRSTGDIQMVFKHDDCFYNNYGPLPSGANFYKVLKGEVIGPYGEIISVPNGTTIRVEVVPADGFEFLVGAFKWYLQDFTLSYNTDGDISNSSIAWTSSTATADDKDQQNGTAITLTRDIAVLGIGIGITVNTPQVLTATMIKSIKITTDPHLST